MSRHSRILIVALAAAAFPVAAFAHTDPQAHVHAHALVDGLIHPLVGVDHLLVMVAIGVWAARSRDIWIAPVGFVAGMTVGLLGGLPVISSVGIELVVALSIIALGLLLAFAVTLPRPATLLLAAGAGLFHGAAHAAEGPLQASVTGFAVGALSTTLVLHALGALTGLATRRAPLSLSRMAGAAMAIFGLGAALAQF